MGNEEAEKHRELEEEMRTLGFKKFTWEVHLKLRQKLFRRRNSKEEKQD